MNLIEKSKKGAAERSAENYMSAVETAVATERLDGNILEGTYIIQEDGNLCPSGETCTDETEIKIEMSGNKPSGGSVTIENGQVVPTGTTMTIGNYNVSYNNEKKTYVATKNEVLCTAVTSKVKALVWNKLDSVGLTTSYKEQEVGLIASESGAYTPGVAYTCELGDGEEEIFYVLEENGDNITLLLGRNLGSTVAWSSDGSNHIDEDESAQAVTVKAALRERTAGWTKLSQNQISMPSGQQIATAGGDTGWTSSNYTGTVLPTWMYSYTKFTDGAYHGYWTFTPRTSRSDVAWLVYSDGNLDRDYVVNDNHYGVRPVITVLKSNLSS